MPADHAPTDDTVLRQPAAPISPQEIAEMRNAFRRTTPGRWNWWTSSSMYRLSTTHDGKDGGVLHAFIAKDGVPDISMSEADRAFVEMAHERWSRLLDAIEALTAEFQSTHRKGGATSGEYHGEADALKLQLAALTAENARLTSALEKANANHERFEREWYLAQDREEALKAELTETRLQCLSHETQAHEAYEAQKKAEAEAIGLQTEMEAAYGILTNSLMAGFVHGHPTVKELQERIYRATATLAVVIFGQPKNWYATQRAKVEAEHAAAKEAPSLSPLTDPEYPALMAEALRQVKAGD